MEFQELRRAFRAVEKGFKHIIATPHYNDFITDNFFDYRDHHADKIQHILDENNIDLQIHCAAEVSFASDWDRVLSESRCFINDKYILVEFSDLHIPDYYLDVMYKIKQRGLTPIIAHPERCSAIQKNKHIISELVRIGAHFQCDAGSLIGQFGDRTKKCAEDLIDMNIYQILGSDAHDIKKRNYNVFQSIIPFDTFNHIVLEKKDLPEIDLNDRRDISFLGKIKRMMHASNH